MFIFPLNFRARSWLVCLIVNIVLNGTLWQFCGTSTVTAKVNGEYADGAVVTIDGNAAGKTPLEIRLVPGTHQIKIHPPAGSPGDPIVIDELMLSIGMEIAGQFCGGKTFICHTDIDYCGSKETGDFCIVAEDCDGDGVKDEDDCDPCRCNITVCQK